MGDDIGYWNISAYNRGMMGYRTPNIDRIASEGGIFTDYYAQQSCTAGRAAFITGQSPIRTGLLKVGLPSAKEGLSDKDPTLAELLKPQGYVTGPVRQEPSRRPQRIPAHRARLRRVLRQPLSPQRGRRAGEPGLPQGRRISEFPRQNFGPARRPQMRSDRDRDSRRRPAVRGLGQAEMRGHRPADEEAHGDRGRRVPRRLARLHRPRQQGQEAVLRLVQLHPDAHLHPSQARVALARPDWASKPTAWSSTTAWSASF